MKKTDEQLQKEVKEIRRFVDGDSKAMKPMPVLGILGGTQYECGNCGDDVQIIENYCPWCGCELDWSDVE